MRTKNVILVKKVRYFFSLKISGKGEGWPQDASVRIRICTKLLYKNYSECLRMPKICYGVSFSNSIKEEPQEFQEKFRRNGSFFFFLFAGYISPSSLCPLSRIGGWDIAESLGREIVRAGRHQWMPRPGRCPCAAGDLRGWLSACSPPLERPLEPT